MKKIIETSVGVGDIFVNNQANDTFAKTHPNVQISSDQATVMTTKPQPASGDKTIPITQKEVIGMQMPDEAYVTNHVFDNKDGKVIGRVTRPGMNKILKFINKEDSK